MKRKKLNFWGVKQEYNEKLSHKWGGQMPQDGICHIEQDAKFILSHEPQPNVLWYYWDDGKKGLKVQVKHPERQQVNLVLKGSELLQRYCNKGDRYAITLFEIVKI